MRTPTTERGKGNGKKTPPPVGLVEPDAEPDFDELVALPTLQLVEAIIGAIRKPADGEADTIRRVFHLAEVLLHKLTTTNDPALLTPIEKLSKDLKEASRRLGRAEARFLVDAYYKMQEDRIRSSHQVRSLAEPVRDKPIEPHDVIAWLQHQEEELEKQIRTALDYYSASDVAGVWARSVKGIGPVISAGLLANIEIEKAPTVGHIWRFAGLDPSSRWLGTVRATELVTEIIREVEEETGEREKAGALSEAVLTRAAARINTRSELLMARLTDYASGDFRHGRADLIRVLAKRPWNAGLKRLCFLIGESFVKVSNRPDDVYGKIYKARKEWETERNRRGMYADQAKAALAEKRFGADTDAFKHYSAGHLPPARIHLRATRRAVKVFLAHLHEVLYWTRYEQLPPNPWVLDYVPGHTHRIAIPNLELLPDLMEAKEAAGQRPRSR